MPDVLDAEFDQDLQIEALEWLGPPPPTTEAEMHEEAILIQQELRYQREARKALLARRKLRDKFDPLLRRTEQELSAICGVPIVVMFARDLNL